MRQDFFAEPLQHLLDLLKRKIALVRLPDKPFGVGGFDQSLFFLTALSFGKIEHSFAKNGTLNFRGAASNGVQVGTERAMHPVAAVNPLFTS